MSDFLIFTLVFFQIAVVDTVFITTTVIKCLHKARPGMTLRMRVPPTEDSWFPSRARGRLGLSEVRTACIGPSAGSLLLLSELQAEVFNM